MFTLTMPLAADELDELLKLRIPRASKKAVTAVQWRDTLSFYYSLSDFGNNDVYGSEADFEDLRALCDAAEEKFDAIYGPPILLLNGETYTPTAEVIEEFRIKNAAVMKELAEEFGQEIFLKAVQFKNLLYLRGIVSQYKFNDPSFLTIPSVRERMNLTAEQRSKLEGIDQEYKQSVNEDLSHLFLTIRDTNSEKLSRLKSESALSPKQEALATQLIGNPLNWTRIVAGNDEREFRRLIGERRRETMEAGFYQVIFPEGCDLGVRNFQKLKLNPNYDANDLKWPHFDSLLATLLTSDFAAKELELSDGQRGELKEFIAQVRETSIVSAKFAKERLESLLEGSAKFPVELEQILVPLQLKRLRQAELQVFTGDHRSTFGLTHPIMVQRLELPSGTVRTLEKTAKEFEEPLSENLSMAETELAKIGLEYGEKRIELLTPKDRERFHLLTGVNCDRLEELMEAVVKPSRIKNEHSLN